MFSQNVAGIKRASTGTLTFKERKSVDQTIDQSNNNYTLKATLASPTFTGTVVIPTPFTLGAVSVLPTGTELNFVDGVTSSIQTQMDLKSPLASPTFTGTAALPIITVAGASTFDAGISHTATVTEYTVLASLDSTDILGGGAGRMGHVDGVVIVAAPSASYVLEFVSAVIIYDYAGAAYAGGSNDLVFQLGASGTQVSVSSAVTSANLLGATSDKIVRLSSIPTQLAVTVAGAISLNSTTFTKNTSAEGLLRVQVTYRRHTTGL